MYRSILVPIDISETDLTRHVVPQVQAHAKTVPFYASLGLAYSTEFPDRSGLQAKASEKLEEIIKQFNIPAGRSQTHVVYGPPKDQILKLAESVDAELIVIASHKPGFSTYLLGSTAAAVVRHAKCPVLVVR